jgi:hypothetical protein
LKRSSDDRSRGCGAQRQLSLSDLGEALERYLGRPWSRQAVHQAERGQRSFTAAELTALALVLDTSVPVLFRAETGQVELPGRALSPEQYRGILLNRDNDAPLDGIEEMIIALHDIGEVLSRPALARLARIGRAAEEAWPQATSRSPEAGTQATQEVQARTADARLARDCRQVDDARHGAGPRPTAGSDPADRPLPHPLPRPSSSPGMQGLA